MNYSQLKEFVDSGGKLEIAFIGHGSPPPCGFRIGIVSDGIPYGYRSPKEADNHAGRTGKEEN